MHVLYPQRPTGGGGPGYFQSSACLKRPNQCFTAYFGGVDRPVRLD